MPTVHENLSCEILLTNSCNMSCDYCIATNIPGPTMSRETGRKAIDMFVYLAQGGKYIEFTFTGGEPLIDFLILKDLTNYAEERTCEAGMQVHFVLKTNGTILNRDIIDFMRVHRIRVVVSIDGTSAVHDKHRRTVSGEGTHNLVCRNLLALLQNQI